MADYETHVRSAKDYLDIAADQNPADEAQDERNLLAAAQVHATLALAAATRANRTVTVREDRP